MVSKQNQRITITLDKELLQFMSKLNISNSELIEWLIVNYLENIYKCKEEDKQELKKLLFKFGRKLKDKNIISSVQTQKEEDISIEELKNILETL